MKKLILGVLLLLCVPFLPCFGEEKVKFGDVSESELKATSYEKDPEASAVVLYEEMNTSYDFNSSLGIQVQNNYFVRIKILTNEGLEHANSAAYYRVGTSRVESESVSGLSGYTYNLVNGKVTKTKLEKANIFEEKVSNSLYKIKFAFPAVQPGSIIEYKFQLVSPYYYYLNDYFFQRSIPVKYSKYRLEIPEFFKFNKETKGMEEIKTTQKVTSRTFGTGNNATLVNFDDYLFETFDLPGLKSESYTWNIKDYLTRVTFELRGIEVPGAVYKDFSNSWANVDKQLLESENFGKKFNLKLFSPDLTNIMKSDMDNKSKIQAVFNLVRSKVKWDETNSLTVDNPKDAFKKGLGSSGEVNALLISALREAGFDAYPVVMSQRNKGRIPLFHATIDNLNYFVVAVDADNKTFYMNAASKYGDLNSLSPECMPDRARSIREAAQSNWVDLSLKCKGSDISRIEMEFNKEGALSGAYQTLAYEESGLIFRKQYADYKNQQEYTEKQEADLNLSLSDLIINNLDSTGQPLKLEYKFTKKDVNTGSDMIYLNPVIVPFMKENPFKSETRKLPVEFSYPVDRRLGIVIKIPNGYTIEELPKSTRLVLNDNQASFQYSVNHDKANNVLNIMIRYQLNQVVFSPQEYDNLRSFFSDVVTGNTAQVVLKKAK